jgi:hypothetical protein
MPEPEVLVEAAEHVLQMTLLVAPSPVHVPDQPLMGVRQLFTLGILITANRPPRSVPQTCWKPRNSKVSGLRPACAHRSAGSLPREQSGVPRVHSVKDRRVEAALVADCDIA